MNVLLSIKPEFVEKIFRDEKKYEFRKSIFKQQVDKVIIYSTMPEGRIVGEFRIECILHDEPELLWEKTKGSAGVSYEFFKEYFSSREEAYAIKIGRLDRYPEPIDPRDFDFPFSAPQSFFYVDDQYRRISSSKDNDDLYAGTLV